MVDSRLLLPPDDHNGPDVHHQGHHRAGDVGVEVEDVLRLVYLICLPLSVVQCKLRTTQINLNKVKIAQIELIPFGPQASKLRDCQHYWQQAFAVCYLVGRKPCYLVT